MESGYRPRSAEKGVSSDGGSGSPVPLPTIGYLRPCTQNRVIMPNSRIAQPEPRRPLPPRAIRIPSSYHSAYSPEMSPGTIGAKQNLYTGLEKWVVTSRKSLTYYNVIAPLICEVKSSCKLRCRLGLRWLSTGTRHDPDNVQHDFRPRSRKFPELLP